MFTSTVIARSPAPPHLHLARRQDACHTFADPYVEQPPLLLFLDLVLLKPGVYRHLLWNRGVGGVQAGAVGGKQEAKRAEEGRWAVSVT